MWDADYEPRIKLAARPGLTPAMTLDDNSRRARFYRRRERSPAAAGRPSPPWARLAPSGQDRLRRYQLENFIMATPPSPLQTLPGKPTHQLGQAIAQLQALRREHAELNMLDAVIDELNRCHQSIQQITRHHLGELDAANNSLGAALQLMWQSEDGGAQGNHLAFMLEPLHAMQMNAASELNRLL